MGFSDKIKDFSDNVQDGVKTSSVSLFNLFLRLLTGLSLGLTMGLIGQELIHFGSFALLLTIVVVTAVITKAMAAWSIGHILIFDLICVLVAMLLRMYILVAP